MKIKWDKKTHRGPKLSFRIKKKKIKNKEWIKKMKRIKNRNKLFFKKQFFL